MWLDDCFLFFFFKQKTAYEMRISDWSSDVCSSDLTTHPGRRMVGDVVGRPGCVVPWRARHFQHAAEQAAGRPAAQQHGTIRPLQRSEERRVGESVAVRMDLGGGRISKKQKQQTASENERS